MKLSKSFQSGCAQPGIAFIRALKNTQCSTGKIVTSMLDCMGKLAFPFNVIGHGKLIHSILDTLQSRTSSLFKPSAEWRDMRLITKHMLLPMLKPGWPLKSSMKCLSSTWGSTTEWGRNGTVRRPFPMSMKKSVSLEGNRPKNRNPCSNEVLRLFIDAEVFAILLCK